MLENDSLGFPTPLRQGFPLRQGYGGQVGVQAPGWRLAALMIVPPFSGPAVDPIRPY